VAHAEVARVLAEWADHVEEDRFHQLHEIPRDLRGITTRGGTPERHLICGVDALQAA
jgi:hypothetical protein